MDMEAPEALLRRVADELLAKAGEDGSLRPHPDRNQVISILHALRAVLFPGAFAYEGIVPTTHAAVLELLTYVRAQLTCQIHRSVVHACPDREGSTCSAYEAAQRQADAFLAALPAIRDQLQLDVEAFLDNDPAARDRDEVILAYPGLFAIMVYRLAHQLHRQGVRLIPRMMTEYAHSRTGIDIHPGAEIGRSFFIDHGTGVVVGETSVIGDRVRLYQGVTLGAFGLRRGPDGRVRPRGKRHPTLEDEVTVYAGATILGGQTVVGQGSVIGGNVWLTESVPPGSKVISRPQIEVVEADKA